MTVIALLLFLIAGTFFAFMFFSKKKLADRLQNDLTKTYREFDAFKAEYIGIIDVAGAIAIKKEQLDELIRKSNSAEEEFRAKTANLVSEYQAKNAQLENDFQGKRKVYEDLLKELSSVEESLEDISYGLYSPHYTYHTSTEYKNKLEHVRSLQKEKIKTEQATYCGIQWTVGDSRAKGIKMVKDASKMMLRAFNGECDAAVAKVSWNNIGTMETRIRKSHEALNKLAAVNQITITTEYLNLKLQELYLEFELEEKIYQEKEEQRKIREQMREEEKALREMEKAAREAEAQENRCEKQLEQAKSDLNKAQGKELEKLTAKIKELEESLKAAHEQKERAISQAQLTKSGYVYIISNIGSFGENVYKIGMTRRLDPQDRVDELGDASVPFDFDVHGMIYSEDAPALEAILHRKFESARVNLVNRRAEFFKIPLTEIITTIETLNLKVQLTEMAEAREYRETISLRHSAAQAKNSTKELADPRLNAFPTSLN